MAKSIDHLLSAMRAEGVDDASFTEAIDTLRTNAPAIVETLFANAEAAVQRGELDLYALPSEITDAADTEPDHHPDTPAASKEHADDA